MKKEHVIDLFILVMGLVATFGVWYLIPPTTVFLFALNIGYSGCGLLIAWWSFKSLKGWSD